MKRMHKATVAARKVAILERQGQATDEWLTRIRKHLAASLARRLPFDLAWSAATLAHRPPDGGREGWTAGTVQFARKAFERAYYGEPAKALIEPEPEGWKRDRVPVASGGQGDRCRSGDGCSHRAAGGSLFCEHHRDELARIRDELDGTRRFNGRAKAAA